MLWLAVVVSDHASGKDREITFCFNLMASCLVRKRKHRGNSQQFLYCKLLWRKSVRLMTNRELPWTVEDTCICLHCSDYWCYRPDTIILKCTVNINNPYSTPHPTQTHQRLQAGWRRGVCQNPHVGRESVRINRSEKSHAFQENDLRVA